MGSSVFCLRIKKLRRCIVFRAYACDFLPLQSKGLNAVKISEARISCFLASEIFPTDSANEKFTACKRGGGIILPNPPPDLPMANPSCPRYNEYSNKEGNAHDELDGVK